MAHLAFLAERLITDKILQAYTSVSSNDIVSNYLVKASGLFAVVGLGFLVFAAHLWLVDHYRPDYAAALTGLVAMGMGLLIALTALAILRYKQSAIKKIQNDISRSVKETIASLDDFLSEPVKKNPKISVVTASAAGFMAGEKLR